MQVGRALLATTAGLLRARSISRIAPGAPLEPLGIVKDMKPVDPSHTHTWDTHLDQRLQMVRFSVGTASGRVEVAEVTETGKALGLHPRDMHLFTLGKHVVAQRATLQARGGNILLRTEYCKAIVTPRTAFLLPARTHRDSVAQCETLLARLTAWRNCEAGGASRADDDAVGASKPQPGADAVAGRHIPEQPFETVVLEALLEGSAHFLERVYRRLLFMSEGLLRDVQGSNGSIIGIQQAELMRLVPLQHALTELQHDLHEVCVALEDVLDHRDDLRSLCLSATPAGGGEPAPSSTTQLSNVLEAFEGRFRSSEGAVKELIERVEASRASWHMRRDGERNQIITINLFLSMASFSLLLITVPAGLFGMNLTSGLESEPGMFWGTVTASTAASGLSFVTLCGLYKWWPHRRHQRQMRDMRVVKDILLQRADCLGDVVAAAAQFDEGPMSKDDFVTRVKQSLRDASSVSEEELELLHRVFDTDKDGFLQLGEVLSSKGKIAGDEPSLGGPAQEAVR